jgi:chromosome segregation ATPase
MEPAIIIAIVSMLAVPIASFITWLLNRKKNVADIYQVITSSSQSAVGTMQAAMETLNIELVNAQDRIDELTIENRDMKKELNLLHQSNALMQQENESLHRRVNEISETLAAVQTLQNGSSRT